MDRFDTMRVFVRIVERRSFTQAAEDLALPRATVTDAIKALEARLGTQLLLRTTRRVHPTLEGEIFYGRCQRLIADLEDAEQLMRDAPRGRLRIEAHGTFARLVLLPRLPAFLARYPDIELDISEGDRYVDLLREGVDCAIRAGALPDSDLVAHRVMMIDEVTVATSDYCARHGVPADPHRLLGDGHVMVGFHSSLTGALLPLSFTQAGGPKDSRLLDVTLPARVRVSGADAYTGAALAGFGIIQAPRYRLAPAIAQGQLIELLPAWPAPSRPVSIVHARTRLPSPRLRAFIDWARESLPADVQTGVPNAVES